MKRIYLNELISLYLAIANIPSPYRIHKLYSNRFIYFFVLHCLTSYNTSHWICCKPWIVKYENVGQRRIFVFPKSCVLKRQIHVTGSGMRCLMSTHEWDGHVSTYLWSYSVHNISTMSNGSIVSTHSPKCQNTLTLW